MANESGLWIYILKKQGSKKKPVEEAESPAFLEYSNNRETIILDTSVDDY